MSRRVVEWCRSGLVALAAASALLGASVAQAQTSPSKSATSAPHAATAPSADGVVNLNDANAEELERLPFVGPAKAKAIVEYRRQHPFRRVEDVVRVKGIGRKTLAKLRPYLTLQGPTTLHEEPRHTAER